MDIPAPAENLNEGDNYQRHGHKSEQNVRSQDWEVNGSKPAFVTRGFFADVRMINDVANEKQYRCNHRSNHASHMASPRPAADQIPARRNKHSAHEIERRI